MLGVFSGIPVGLVTGYSRRAGAMISPIMAFIRPIPPITLTPYKLVKTAQFMNKLGTIKTPVSSWKQLFFPEVHGLPGD